MEMHNEKNDNFNGSSCNFSGNRWTCPEYNGQRRKSVANYNCGRLGLGNRLGNFGCNRNDCRPLCCCRNFFPKHFSLRSFFVPDFKGRDFLSSVSLLQHCLKVFFYAIKDLRRIFKISSQRLKTPSYRDPDEKNAHFRLMPSSLLYWVFSGQYWTCAPQKPWRGRWLQQPQRNSFIYDGLGDRYRCGNCSHLRFNR